MANTFGILTALVLVFAAYVAHKNGEFLEQTVASVENETSNLAKNKRDLQTINEEIAELDAETAEFEKEKAAKQTEVDRQNAKNSDQEALIAEKEAEAREAEAQADASDEKIQELGNIKELITELGDLKSSIADLDDQLSVSESQVATLENEKNVASTNVKDLTSQLSARNSGKSYFVSSRISSVYRNWGFVTIAAGDLQGVVNKSKLKVVRGDRPIAELIVTAVEANSAAANIVPSSVNPDEQISVGDVVVPAEDLEGEKLDEGNAAAATPVRAAASTQIK